MRTPLAPLLLLAALLPAAAAEEVPRADVKVIDLVNDGARFETLRGEVHEVVVEHGRAKDDVARAAIADRLARDYGVKAIEVLVRYREPHLIPVFARLTEAGEWYVRRLAVFALQRNLALSEMDRVVARLGDENPLVREIAATTTAILHFAAKKHRELIPRAKPVIAAAKRMGKRKKADLKALEAALEKETNEYVKSSLAGAIEVMGRRPLLLIHTEPTTGEAPGRYVPRLSGGEINRYQEGSGFSASGGGKLRPSKAWGYPILLYPHEIFTTSSDRPLVPLPKRQNSYHYGHDCGWFLEGSSIYAIGDGALRWVRSGGDWGGLVVAEYMTEKREKVVGLNGHCGMWVFAKPGESVKKGQLLAQMGLSFSAENGGHGAHDHFGMYAGGFSEGHCYGRSRNDRTGEDWLVPADFLGPRVAGEKIVPDSYR